MTAHARPLALVTNDDGYQSGFLEALVVALKTRFEVVVTAPASEQSWSGRAMTRRRAVRAHPISVADCSGWAVEGTPTDCINLALGNLLADSRRPDLVLSGINIGYNTTLPLLLSSGTIAGALEGAHWGLPAIAVSMAVGKDHFEAVTANHARNLPPPVVASLEAAAEHAVQFAAQLPLRPNEDLCVENLNFPAQTTCDTKLHATVPARLTLGGLFEAEGNDATTPSYRFRYQTGALRPSPTLTDRAALLEGKASHTALRFGQIGAIASSA